MKNSTRIAFAALALVAVATLGACNNNKTESSNATMEAKATPVNKTCPFSGEEAKANVTSNCDGKTVAFCCASCKGKFDKMDHAKQEAMMNTAK